MWVEDSALEERARAQKIGGSTKTIFKHDKVFLTKPNKYNLTQLDLT